MTQMMSVPVVQEGSPVFSLNGTGITVTLDMLGVIKGSGQTAVINPIESGGGQEFQQLAVHDRDSWQPCPNIGL